MTLICICIHVMKLEPLFFNKIILFLNTWFKLKIALTLIIINIEYIIILRKLKKIIYNLIES